MFNTFININIRAMRSWKSPLIFTLIEHSNTAIYKNMFNTFININIRTMIF
jgi:hypothetical protein